jgi:hypothetical protein
VLDVVRFVFDGFRHLTSGWDGVVQGSGERDPDLRSW